MHAAVFPAHAKRHQRAAVEQVDPGPVPAGGLGGEVGARPFVVEPGAAHDLPAVDAAEDLQVGLAVVVAGLLGTVTLSAETRLALQKWLVGSEKRQVHVEFPRCDLRAVLISLEHQPPVVDPDAGAVGLGLRQREPGARRALLVDQAAALRVGDGGVGKQYLERIEAARVVGLLLRPRTEESDLEAHRPVEPAGDIPPLGAVLRMRAVIAGKNKTRPRRDHRIAQLRRPGDERQAQQADKGAPPHQSSRTARTGPIPIASLPETIAVTTARKIKSAINAARRRKGTCNSMLQLNDWRLIT